MQNTVDIEARKVSWEAFLQKIVVNPQQHVFLLWIIARKREYVQNARKVQPKKCFRNY